MFNRVKAKKEKLDTNQKERLNNIGVCYLQLQQYDSAIIVLKTGKTFRPKYNPFYENLALAYKLTNNKDSAKIYESKAQQNNQAFRVY